MMPDQFVAKLSERFPSELRREALLTARIIFDLQTTTALDLRTISGMRLLDVTDWKEFFQEVGDVLAERTVRPLPLQFRRAADPAACSDCGHVHEGKTECGHYLGEEKFCRCEAKVTA
jgi:hypothetical protein